MSDAPISSSIDAGTASSVDAAGGGGGMIVAHVIYLAEARWYYTGDQNSNESHWFADNVVYQTAHNAFVRGRPYTYMQIVYWLELGPLEFRSIIWPPSKRRDEIPAILGHVPAAPHPRPPTAEQLNALLRAHARGVTHVFHSIDYSIIGTGEERDAMLVGWLASDAERNEPLSSPLRIVRHFSASPQWADWGARIMAQLPDLHAQWLEDQP